MRFFHVTVVVPMVLFSPVVLSSPGDVAGEIAAPGKTCTGLAFDGDHIWVADHGLDELLAVDPGTARVARRLKSPGYRPAGLAFDGSHLWCADVRDALVYRIRPSDGLVTRTIPIAANLPWGQLPRSVAFDGKALWVTDDKLKSIHRVDPLDGTTLHEIPFPGKSVDGMTFDGRYLWVADRLADRLYAVYPVTGDVLVALKSPGPHPSGLAFNGKELLVVDYQTDRITTVVRNDKDFLVHEDPREAWVVLTHQVRNFGPDPLTRLEVFVAHPRDLPGQQLMVAPDYAPTPREMLADQWGQKVARFEFRNLLAGMTATVNMKVHLKTRSIRYVIYPEDVQSLWKIPGPIRRRYLADGSKYDIKNSVIRKAVSEAVGSERNPYWIAKRIYRYVHDRMHYERVGGWDVAPKVLQRGSGSCSEYAYVYISMCRAAGLPARYIGSLVVRKDDASYDEVFHRWVETYLPPYGWVPVDPSRGDKPTEAERGAAFGHLSNDFLITTESGGGSSLLDWSYNYNERWTCKGRCKVDAESLAEWSPEDPQAQASGQHAVKEP